jgi:hypothetical protein
VSVGGLVALDQVLRDLVKFDLFWDFNSLSKEERKMKQILRDLSPFLGTFWDLGICNGNGMSAHEFTHV